MSKINELNESDIDISKKHKDTSKSFDERLNLSIKGIDEKI